MLHASTRSNSANEQRTRQRWMGILARADVAQLEARLEALPSLPRYALLRAPEPGLVMVQARAGGSGAPFHLGEMTATRCSLRLGDDAGPGDAGTVGHGYVQGRNQRHAELAALADALLQNPLRRPQRLADIIEPLAEAQRARRRAQSRKAAATRVEFFNLVRGENAR